MDADVLIPFINFLQFLGNWLVISLFILSDVLGYFSYVLVQFGITNFLSLVHVFDFHAD